MNIRLLLTCATVVAVQDIIVNQISGNTVFQRNEDWYSKVLIPYFDVNPHSPQCATPVVYASASVLDFMLKLTKDVDRNTPLGGYVVMTNATYDEASETLYKSWSNDVRGVRRYSCYLHDSVVAEEAIVQLQYQPIDFTYASSSVVILGPVQWGRGFYHWFIDSLVNLVQIPDHVLINATIMLSDTPHRWRPFLNYFGYGHIPIFTPAAKRRYIFGTAYLPSGNNCGSQAQSRVDQLFKQFEHSMPPYPQKPNVTLLVSRKGSSRNLRNWDMMVTRLKNDYGHEQEFIEHSIEHTAIESMHMFYKASTIIGLHGAGMVQMLFARSGTKVVEITPAPMYGPERPVNYCYPLLGCLRRLPYWLHTIQGTYMGYTDDLNIEAFMVLMKSVYAYS